MKICKKFEWIREHEGGYLVKLDNAFLKIYFLTQSIVRLRVSFTDDISDMEKPESSYVLKLTAWKDAIDDFLGDERKHVQPVIANLSKSADNVQLSSGELLLTIEKDPLNIRLTDTEGHIIYETVKGNPFVKDSNNRVVAYTRMNSGDYYYGFGEKTGLINKNKELIREHATDSYAYDAQKCGTLYKHIPFYIHLDSATGKAAGFFYNNFHESEFNIGYEKSNYWPEYLHFRADGGELDLFIMTGPKMSKVLDDYTLLTGRPALLPKRALGYQGSSMYYSELPKDCDEALLNFVATVKKKGFPIDGFHLSSGYTTVDGKRCVFTWNKERFSDPKAFFEKMNELGAQCVPNVKPGVLLAHPGYERYKENDAFVKDSESEEPAIFPWWGGNGSFWDFTNPDARTLWTKELTESLIETGTDSIWNDNCEYDSVLDMDCRCDCDGIGGTIGALKPVMSTIMSKLSFDAVKEHNESARPYIVCRSGSSGIQAYAQNWVGDNYTCWETLKYNVPTLLGVGLSGQPNTGCDIGGFAGPAPSEELFVRWVQHGIFQPRFSIHSANSDNTVTEPWMYPGSTDKIRNAILLRYRMLPHLYSLEALSHECGAPIMRALAYEFQDDADARSESFEFMLGRDLLVANVLEEGAKEITVYLPKGTKWYELENNYKCYEGGQRVTIPVTLDSIPRFLREGAILPMAVDQPMNAEKDPVTHLSLTLIPYEGEDKEASYICYDDDGRSNDYLGGVYRRTMITMSGRNVVTVDFKGNGTYQDTVDKVTVTMVSRAKSPLWISFDGEKLNHILDREEFEKENNCWYYCHTDRTVIIKYDNPRHDATLKVSFEEFDLIGM